MYKLFLIKEIPWKSEVDIQWIDGIVGNQKSFFCSGAFVHMIHIDIETAMF